MTAHIDSLPLNKNAGHSVGDILSGVWQEFSESVHGIGLGRYQSREETRSVLSHNMTLLHKLLLGSPEYRQLVDSRYRMLTRNKYWGWKSVHNDDQLTIGVFSLYRNAPIPLHDHPGTQGVIMVLEGELELERFTLPARYRDDNRSGMVELNRCSRQTLSAFDVAWFQTVEGNLQGLRALSEQCVLLKVQLPGDCTGERSWYFPVHGVDDLENSIPARRIISRYL